MLDAVNNHLSGIFSKVQTNLAHALSDDNSKKQSNDNFKKLSDSKVIQINNELNGIFNDQIKLPRIVVVGGQSSGKSTVLNNIITMNILPTGSEMVTRTPLCIELSPSDASHVEFGSYTVKSEIDNNVWKCSKHIKVTYPEASFDELLSIKNEIERLTNIIAGKEKNISHQTITVKIFLPGVPNLTLIDLPGITQIACRDKGQPSDIKDQIEKLIGNYIKHEETIILSVIPARTDVEADVGVGLVKKYDPEFTRSIGVLTKVDLMNVDTDVSSYVKGDISKNLRMNYGYYLVRNRSNKEMAEITMIEGFDKEMNFFKEHRVYSTMNDYEKKKMGTYNLRDKLVCILIDKIKEYLPIVSKQINQKYNDVCKELIEMGVEVPTNSLGKQTYIHHLILNLSQKFVHSLDGLDKESNIGRTIKDDFIKYKNNVCSINSIDNFDTKYIDEISKNIEGNHMSFLLPSIGVFEACIRDEKYKPIQKLLQPSLDCIKSNSKQLSNLIIELLNSSKNEIYRYPKLIVYLENKIINHIILTYEEKTTEYVTDLINMEECYIWTDSEVFQKNMAEIMKGKTSIESNTIKTLLVAYYNTVKDNIKNNIPKAIMLHLVMKLKNNLLNEIMNKIDNNEIVELLEENRQIFVKRKELIEWKNKLDVAKRSIS
jgi:hypothetical protein